MPSKSFPLVPSFYLSVALSTFFYICHVPLAERQIDEYDDIAVKGWEIVYENELSVLKFIGWLYLICCC